jgi:hypothetical protein
MTDFAALNCALDVNHRPLAKSSRRHRSVKKNPEDVGTVNLSLAIYPTLDRIQNEKEAL